MEETKVMVKGKKPARNIRTIIYGQLLLCQFRGFSKLLYILAIRNKTTYSQLHKYFIAHLFDE